MPFNTPILFLIFNRPDTTKQVFEKIREIQPKYLYVAADGPRTNKEGEKELCETTRNIVLDNIDWDCEVKTLLRDENLGCGKAVSSAITWFFENVEQGIIMEDDTLPKISFFTFCEEMLVKYKENARIMSISGTNFLSSVYKTDNSYLFSEYGGIWGWASWRRAWKGYDYTIASWSTDTSKNHFKKKYSSNQYHFFEDVFDKVHSIDTWDYQWWYHRLRNDGLSIIPSVNLVKNIGFDLNATHTHNASDEIKNMQYEEVFFPLLHPKTILLNNDYDFVLAENYYSKKKTNSLSVFSRILNKIKFIKLKFSFVL